MANYAVLKAAINAVIKTNGNKEITGQVLNQTLMAIVDSLGENYQFAGVAVPSTNPGTPDQNIFYLAAQAGTYTNFGATVLPAGISMLEWKNNTWSSETFFTIDDAPTAGSSNLVKSGGVKTAIDNVAFSTNEKVKDVGIDSTPTSGSDNLIKSGAVFDAFKNDGGAYDVSVHFPTGGVEGGNTYTLDGAIAMVPQNMQKGGMIIKFVSSSDNKYVQYRYMGIAVTGTPNPFLDTANWQKQGAEVTISQNNQTGHTDITIGTNTTPVASVNDINQLEQQLESIHTLSTTWEDNYFTKDTGIKVQVSSGYHYGKCATAEVSCEQYVGKTLNFNYGIDSTLDITTIAFVGYSDVILEVYNYTAKGSVTFTIPSSSLYIRVGVEGTTSDRLAGCKSGISLKVTTGSKLGDLEQLTTEKKDNFVDAINEVNEIASSLPSLLYKVDNYVLNWEDNMLLRSNSDTQAGFIIPIDSGYNLNRCAATTKVACAKSVGEKLKIYCATGETRVSFYSGVEGQSYNGGQDYTEKGEVEITIPNGTTYFVIGYYDDNSSPASLDYVHAKIATISASAISEYYIRENTKLIQGTSLYTGKKFYSIGDSICAQEMWQPHLAALKQMDYQSAATRSATYPLGIGGSTICPKIQTTTSNNGDEYKVLDGNGNQVRNSNNEPLWFVVGRAPGQSIYIRAKFFEDIYDDAEVVVINAGANDSIGLNPVINSCDSVGEASDTAYTGLEYVDTGNAVVAKYYPNVAIYDDGTLDEEYKNGDYTILTSRPSLIACLKGLITTIVTACPEAMLVGNQIMRPNNEYSSLSAYSAKVAGIKTAYQYYCIPVADMWNEMGVSNLNITYYYKNDSPDPTVRVHPNDLGGQRMAMIIANKL